MYILNWELGTPKEALQHRPLGQCSFWTKVFRKIFFELTAKKVTLVNLWWWDCESGSNSKRNFFTHIKTFNDPGTNTLQNRLLIWLQLCGFSANFCCTKEPKIWHKIFLVCVALLSFFKWAIPGLFSIRLTVNKCSTEILPMTGLKPRNSGVGSDGSSNYDKITAQMALLVGSKKFCSIGPWCCHIKWIIQQNTIKTKA